MFLEMSCKMPTLGIQIGPPRRAGCRGSRGSRCGRWLRCNGRGTRLGPFFNLAMTREELKRITILSPVSTKSTSVDLNLYEIIENC